MISNRPVNLYVDTPEQGAEKLIDSMRHRGRKVAIIVRQCGRTVTKPPSEIHPRDAENVIGHYTPEIARDHLAEDLRDALERLAKPKRSIMFG